MVVGLIISLPLKFYGQPKADSLPVLVDLRTDSSTAGFLFAVKLHFAQSAKSKGGGGQRKAQLLYEKDSFSSMLVGDTVHIPLLDTHKTAISM